MDALIIYDETGYIIFQATGNLREPIGVPFMWVEVPEGKRVVGVDVSGETHVPVFADLPKSEVQLLQEKVVESEQAILELSTILGGMM